MYYVETRYRMRASETTTPKTQKAKTMTEPKTYPIVSDAKPFTKTDWYGYAGCEYLPIDGKSKERADEKDPRHDPVMGHVEFSDEHGYCIIVDGGAFFIHGTMNAWEDESQEIQWERPHATKDVPSQEKAIKLANRIIEMKPRTDEDFEALGFRKTG